MTSPTDRLRLSVVVASIEGPASLERCLRVLAPQAHRGETEIVVAGAFGADQQRRYPAVAFLPFPAGTPGPTLWGAALARARGDLVGVTETRTVVSDTWVRDVLASCRPGASVVGGAVEPSQPRGLVGWAAYFCDYGAFMRPLEPGPAAELPGNNTVFPRDLLGRAEAFTRPAFWKTYWCRALQAEGVALVADPSFVVYDAKTYRLAEFLVRRFRHGRCFAGMRNAQLSPSKRVLYASAAPGLPVVLLVRLVRRLIPKRRHRWRLVASAPVVVLAVVAWSAGEALGYAAGSGQSCRNV